MRTIRAMEIGSKLRIRPIARRKANGKNIRLLIVDDHAMFRRVVRSIVTPYPDIEVIGEASDGYGAVVSLGQLKPDVVLMDAEDGRGHRRSIDQDTVSRGRDSRSLSQGETLRYIRHEEAGVAAIQRAVAAVHIM